MSVLNKSSEIVEFVALPIGDLFPVVQMIEADKGLVKQVEDRLKINQGKFYDLASGRNVVWSTSTEQKVCNVRQQSRSTVDVDALLALGVSQAIIDAAKKVSRYPVFRSN